MIESYSATRTTEQQFESSSIVRRFITQVNSGHFLGGGGGYSGLMFVGYVQLASQSPYPIIVYFWANYRPQLSHFPDMVSRTECNTVNASLWLNLISNNFLIVCCVLKGFKVFLFFQCCHNKKYSLYQDSYFVHNCFDGLFILLYCG